MEVSSEPAQVTGAQARDDVDRLDQLGKSVDWCWTLDSELRLVAVEATTPGSQSFRDDLIVDRPPWDWPGVIAADAAALRARLEEHRPLDWFPLALRGRRGEVHHIVARGEPVFDAAGVFCGYRGTARDATEQRREAALLKLEHDVTRALSAAPTARKMLQAVMRVICESENWDTGGYFRVVDAQGTTCLEAGWVNPAIPPESLAYYKASVGRRIPPGGLLSHVAASGEPMWVRDLRASRTTWRERVRATGERAALLFAVHAEGEVIGVFAFGSREPRAPDPRALQSLRAIGEQASQFLQRQRAEQELQESEARFRALTDLSSDWYWETDVRLCLTRLDGRRVEEGDTFPGRGGLGKRLAEANLDYETAADADLHRDALQARAQFHDIALVLHGADGARRVLSVSGAPMLDGNGAFSGYRGVGRDITALRQAEATRAEAVRLQAENQTLEESNRLKALFLATMSHELRTPLNGITGFTHLLRAHAAKVNDLVAADYGRHLGEASQDLLRLIEQLLTFAQVEARRVEFHPVRARLSTLIAEAQAVLAEPIRRRSIAVTHELDPAADDVVVDVLRLKQVIGAYLSNAVKFSPVNGHVVIRTRALPQGRVQLEVQDHGIGIAAADLPRLFVAFHQLSEGARRTYEGAGIGLAMVRLLVEAQGGTVGVSSVPGGGSTFHAVLPRVQGAGVA